jgi:hypothetical protein
MEQEQPYTTECAKCGQVHNRCAGHPKKKNTGGVYRPCNRFPMQGKRVCHQCGGKTPQGFASPNFKHGRHSKYLNHLPESKRARFDLSLEQSKAASVAEEIGITTVHQQELLELLDDSTIVERWHSVTAAIEQARKFFLEPEKLTKIEAQTLTKEIVLDRLQDLTDEHNESIRLWEKIHDINDKMRKLNESQSKIQLNNIDISIKENKYIPVEFVRQFVRTVAEIFDLAPEEIRLEQLRALQARYNALPETIKEDKYLTEATAE